jgi:hypothetical protein
MTLARFGIEAAALTAMVAQSASTGFLRLSTQAAELRPLTTDLIPGQRETEQITQITITIRRVPYLHLQQFRSLTPVPSQVSQP